jgi:acyl-CoA thioester hydrolase
MPLTHTSTYKIRFYECDPYGHVNNTNYLRYMQEAAFEASAAAGYDVQRYEQIGRTWHVHATDIEYLRPLKYGDAAQVKTWVLDARKVTSRRAYELYSASTGELAAKATTDWAFLDTASGKPAPIPSDLLEAIAPGGLPEPTREKFPVQPTPPEGAFRMRRCVQWRELDSARHVNNAIYAEWGEEGGMQCIAHFGWPASRMANAGLGIFYKRMWMEYLQPAHLDDEVEITAWLSDVKRASGLRHFSMTRVNDGVLLARITVQAVCANIATGMPTRWPQDMLADFAPNIAKPSPSPSGGTSLEHSGRERG